MDYINLDLNNLSAIDQATIVSCLLEDILNEHIRKQSWSWVLNIFNSWHFLIRSSMDFSTTMMVLDKIKRPITLLEQRKLELFEILTHPEFYESKDQRQAFICNEVSEFWKAVQQEKELSLKFRVLKKSIFKAEIQYLMKNNPIANFEIYQATDLGKNLEALEIQLMNHKKKLYSQAQQIDVDTDQQRKIMHNISVAKDEATHINHKIASLKGRLDTITKDVEESYPASMFFKQISQEIYPMNQIDLSHGCFLVDSLAEMLKKILKKVAEINNLAKESTSLVKIDPPS